MILVFLLILNTHQNIFSAHGGSSFPTMFVTSDEDSLSMKTDSEGEKKTRTPRVFLDKKRDSILSASTLSTAILGAGIDRSEGASVDSYASQEEEFEKDKVLHPSFTLGFAYKTKPAVPAEVIQDPRLSLQSKMRKRLERELLQDQNRHKQELEKKGFFIIPTNRDGVPLCIQKKIKAVFDYDSIPVRCVFLPRV